MAAVAKDWLFILNSTELGELTLKNNPVEWQDVETVMEREGHGIVYSFTGEFTYIKDGYQYIKQGLQTYGIIWNCYLTVKAFNHKTFTFDTILATKKLDFTSVTETNEWGKCIKIPLTDSDILERLKSRENELIPYARLETLDGQSISPYENEFISVHVLGQELAETDIIGDFDEVTKSIEGTGIGSDPTGVFFTGITPRAQDTRINYTPSILTNLDNVDKISKDYCFFGTTVNCKINLALELFYRFDTNLSFPNTKRCDIELLKCNIGQFEPYPTQITVLKGEYLTEFNEHVFLYNGSLELEPYQYLVVRVIFDAGGELSYHQANFKVKDSSFVNVDYSEKAEPTDILHAPIWQVHDRLITAITGQTNVFESSVFSDGGKWSYLMLSNGYLYRQYSIDDAQLSFKWKELTETMERLLGVAYGFVNGKIICEDYATVYKDETIDKEFSYQQDSFSRELNIDHYYSAISVGVNKKEYEQENGLIMSNTLTNYSTAISVIENVMDLETQYQVDGNWAEFARRLKRIDGTTIDSQYDNDIFIFETIDLGGVITQRTIEDFDSIAGLDTISSPINLNLTPARALYRNSQFISIGLQPFKDKPIVFNKSEVKTELATVRNDESVTVAENSNIDYFNEPIFSGYVLKANVELTMADIMELISDPFKKINIKDELSGELKQGWVKRASTKPIGDSLTNIEIYEAATITPPTPEAMEWLDNDTIDLIEFGVCEWQN